MQLLEIRRPRRQRLVLGSTVYGRGGRFGEADVPKVQRVSGKEPRKRTKIPIAEYTRIAEVHKARVMSNSRTSATAKQ